MKRLQLNKMKISLNCKLDPAGAFGFIKPITDLNEIKHIDVFRDTNALPCQKVSYHNSVNSKNGIISQISKFFKMLFVVNKEHKLAVGIYEIPHGLLAFVIGKLKKIPVVISIIGNPAHTDIRKGFRKAITYYMLKHCFAVTVTGSKSKQFLIDEGISGEKIKILPNSIDIDKFHSNDSSQKKYDIISLGRLSSEKKLDNLLSIIKKIATSNPEIKVGIAGKGPEKDKIMSIIKKFNLEDNIFLLGYVGYVDDIVKFYNSGKVFVLTSRTEGLPRTVLEAMSCGIPCVTSNVGDIKDIIDDGENGFIVNNYLYLDLYVERILLLLNNNEVYRKISEAAQVEIKNSYSYEAATKVWKEIIDKI